jgi:CBS domain-containing protein
MLVREVMVTDVTVISTDTTIDSAAQIMADLDVGALPVGDEDAVPEGILTGRDILLRVVAPRRDPRTVHAGEVMSRDLVCCRAEDEVEAVRREMERHQIRRMPVVDAEGRMVGMLTEADLARASASSPGGAGPR